MKSDLHRMREERERMKKHIWRYARDMKPFQVNLAATEKEFGKKKLFMKELCEILSHFKRPFLQKGIVHVCYGDLEQFCVKRGISQTYGIEDPFMRLLKDLKDVLRQSKITRVKFYNEPHPWLVLFNVKLLAFLLHESLTTLVDFYALNCPLPAGLVVSFVVKSKVLSSFRLFFAGCSYGELNSVLAALCTCPSLRTVKIHQATGQLYDAFPYLSLASLLITNTRL